MNFILKDALKDVIGTLIISRRSEKNFNLQIEVFKVKGKTNFTFNIYLPVFLKNI